MDSKTLFFYINKGRTDIYDLNEKAKASFVLIANDLFAFFLLMKGVKNGYCIRLFWKHGV